MSFLRETQPSQAHTVFNRVEEPLLRELLSALLGQWGIETREENGPALSLRFSVGDEALVLAFAGSETETLPLPVNVEGLWLSLQKHLFEPPREHYRIPLRVRGMLYQQQQGEDFISLSLSDAGLRFEFTRELVRNETVRLDIPLGGENITVDGKVIYCVPTRKSNRMVIGVVFDYRQKEVREVLRGFLVESTLLQVRRNMDGSRFAKALDFFDLDDFSRTRLLR